MTTRALASWTRRLGLGALAALLLASCSQKPISVPLRSLERSGKLTLLCLDLGSTGEVGYSLEDCQARKFATKPGGTQTEVRLYALVNQTTRGEVALLDVGGTSVVDADGSRPGYNFLPVGAQPVDIVATPEGTATFVASAEANRPGIYALPSKKLLGRRSQRDWPACALPARPGAMSVMVAPAAAPADPLKTPDHGFCPGPNFATDPPAPGNENAPPPPDEKTKAENRWTEAAAEAAKIAAAENRAVERRDLANAAHPNGALSLEEQTPGARKLLVALPTEGELLVIDAQSVLDREPGTFDVCPIERRIKLDSPLPDTVELPGAPPPGDECPARPATSLQSFCPVRKPQTADYPATYEPFPVAFAQADRTLYVADEHAPLIHSYDFSDPCAPVQLPPLLPSSFDQPWRPVSTRALAVSPVTSDNKRFLYAVDALDGSAMVFDLTAGGRSPVVRSRPEYFPFSPRDRISLGAPIRDLLFIEQDYYPYDLDGTKVTGLRCDPGRPRGTDAAASYQTTDDLADGAAPDRLRGVFALAALTSGQVVIIDVDDYDAACRRARGRRDDADKGATDLPDWVTGCDNVCTERDEQNVCKTCSSSTPSAPYASGEGSCRVVVRHEIRSNNYILNTPSTGRNRPDQVTFPSLTLKGSALRTDVDSASDEARQNPKLLGPINDASIGGDWLFTSDGTTALGTGNPSPAAADRNFIVPDIRDPRVAVNQDWSLTYEGVLPGTVGRIGRLTRSEDGKQRVFYDLNGGLCYLGVHDESLAELEWYQLASAPQPKEEGAPTYPELDLRNDEVRRAFAQAHADWLEITNPLLDEEDPYWTNPNGTGVEDKGTCSYLRCRATFGTPQAPTPARSFRIQRAYHDRAYLSPNPTVPGYTSGDDPLLVRDATKIDDFLDPECCFPTQVTYQVRGGSTWIAVGSASGFLHRTTLGADNRCALLGFEAGVDENGKPKSTLCDASFATRTGRAYEVPGSGAGRPAVGRKHTDPYAFHNPYFYFLVYAGSQPSRRDMSFSWQMLGGFVPLEISTGRGSVQVAPQSMVYHPALGTEVLVTDAALQGVQTIDLFNFVVSRSFL